MAFIKRLMFWRAARLEKIILVLNCMKAVQLIYFNAYFVYISLSHPTPGFTDNFNNQYTFSQLLVSLRSTNRQQSCLMHSPSTNLEAYLNINFYWPTDYNIMHCLDFRTTVIFPLIADSLNSSENQ